MILTKRRLKTRRIRADDYATIGAILAAVLVPAILWKRAHPVNCASFLTLQ